MTAKETQEPKCFLELSSSIEDLHGKLHGEWKLDQDLLKLYKVLSYNASILTRLGLSPDEAEMEITKFPSRGLPTPRQLVREISSIGVSPNKAKGYGAQVPRGKDEAPPLPASVKTWKKNVSSLISSFEDLEAKAPLLAASAKMRRELMFTSYQSVFKEARRMQRRFHLVLGPTNSGKTHDAMEALSKAPSGLYLGPLRLLALENYERLKSSGLRARLETGEESYGDEGPSHISMTIEKCDFETPMDVAVIDEIQMLSDPARGGAWTAALLGVPAKDVYLLGAPEALDIIKYLLKFTGDTFDVVIKERLSPLTVARGVLSSIKDIREGDGIITFSRDSVLGWKKLLDAEGIKSSLVYGGLSPEVRRAESERFRSGETKVLIATDAVGMGLNLPLKRVVFSETKKFDGVAFGDLSQTSTKQIAGRAGRYGMHEGGEATGFAGGDLAFISDMLGRPAEQIKNSEIFAAPLWLHINALREMMGTENLPALLKAFGYEKMMPSEIFKKVSSEQIAVSEFIEEKASTGLSLKQKFRLSMLAIDTKDEEALGMLQKIIESLVKKDKIPAFEELFPAEVASEELKMIESLRRRISVYIQLELETGEPSAQSKAFRLLCDEESSQRLEEARKLDGGAEASFPRACRQCRRSMGIKSKYETCRECSR